MLMTPRLGRWSRTLATLILSAAATGAAVAEEASHALDPIVVTATRTAQALDDSPVPTRVIMRADIERRAAWDPTDLLRFQPGLSLARTGGPGQPVSLFLQGTESNHTLVLVDGVPIHPGTLGNPPLQHLPPALIERVEIVQAPRSALYGSQAIGGVVQIFTRDLEGTGAYTSATAGPDQARRVAAGLHHRAAGWRFGVHGVTDRTDGFPTRVDSELDRGHRSNALSAHAGIDTGPLTWTLRHWRSQGRNEYLGFLGQPLAQDVATAVTQAQVTHPVPADGRGTLRWSRFRDRIEQRDSADEADTRRDRIEWQANLPVTARQALTAGVVHEREHVAATSFGTVYDTVTDRWAVYLQDDLRLGRHRLLAAVRHARHDGFGEHVTWDAAYGYRWRHGTRLRLYAGTAFRAPDATDRFGFGGNPDLDPETSRQFGAVVEQALGRHHILGARFYVHRVRDLIAYDGGQMRNVDAARIRGTTLSYRYREDAWDFRLAATVQSARDADSGEALPRRPRHRLVASLARRWGPQTVTVDFLAEGERRDSAYSDATLGGYGLLNLSLHRELGRHWSLTGTLVNALDKEYALADGYTVQDRALFLTVRYQIRNGADGG